MPAVPVPGSVLRGWSFRQSSGKTGDEEPRLNDRLHDESRASFDKADTLPTKQNTEKMNSTNRENFKSRFQTMRQNKSYTVPSRRSEVVSGPRICQSFSDDENTESCMIEKELNKYNRHALFKDSKGTQDISYSSNQPTIALFGASGVTGGHFLTAALDAGYNVRCLQVDDPREAHPQSDWATVKLGLEDDEQIRATVTAADYVVIMLGDVLPGKQEYPSGFLLSFVERLYDILREEESVQVVLFQATSLATDVNGRVPILSKVIKTMAQRRSAFLRDQDDVIDRIGIEHGLRHHNEEHRSVDFKPPHFRFIVTRPSILLQDGPSSRKLAASKSQPGPFPVSHIDLADFSLSALTTEKMYDTSPYVVADSF